MHHANISSSVVFKSSSHIGIISFQTWRSHVLKKKKMSSCFYFLNKSEKDFSAGAAGWK
jgi:hypothetical protein